VDVFQVESRQGQRSEFQVENSNLDVAMNLVGHVADNIDYGRYVPIHRKDN
jgi:hypothetical protein